MISRVKDTESFINKSLLIHGDKYDYSLVDYKGSKSKVIITCKKHKQFLQTPNNHLNGKGCEKCAIQKKSNGLRSKKEDVLEKFRIIHLNKYDYSLVEYKNNKTKIKIICPTHGEFLQKPSHHLSGHGCRNCVNEINSRNYAKKWTDGETRWLLDNSKKYSEVFCCNFLNVSLKTLMKKAKDLNIQFFSKKNPYKFHDKIQSFYWKRTIRGAETRGLEFSIDIDYVWDIFLKQDGKCALSGVKIKFSNIRENTASIDRIDSKKGYIYGNIQIVHKKINMLKTNMPDQEFVKWCKLIAQNNNL